MLDNAAVATQSVTNGYAAGTAVHGRRRRWATVSRRSTRAAWDGREEPATARVALCRAADEKTLHDHEQAPPDGAGAEGRRGRNSKPGDFTIGITATNPDKPSVTGSAAGTVVTVDPGTFQAAETNPSPLYTVSYSAGLRPGESSTSVTRSGSCTVTNTRRPYGITVTKTARRRGDRRDGRHRHVRRRRPQRLGGGRGRRSPRSPTTRQGPSAPTSLARRRHLHAAAEDRPGRGVHLLVPARDQRQRRRVQGRRRRRCRHERGGLARLATTTTRR